MNKFQSTMTTPDQRGLHYRLYGPSHSDFADVELAIVVVHGLGEHSGCYDDFGSRMSDKSIATFAYDQHGHGKSPGRRGDAPSFDVLIDDISVALAEAKRHFPKAELVLLGHSMGGNLVLNHMLDRSDRSASRAIVTNPMILPPNPPTKPQAFAAWLTTKIIPRVRFSSDVEVTDLTQDPDAAIELASDPLIHQQLSIEIGGQLLSHGHWLIEHSNQLARPLLMLTGSDDDLCDSESTLKFVDNAGESCDHRRFDGLRHSLLLEKNRDDVYASIFEWLRYP